MKTIVDIYDDFGIPQGLQIHMLRVAGIAEQILSVWNGPKVDRTSLIRVLLVHDIGNIVKMSKDDCPTDRCMSFRNRFLEKFGYDDHRVSKEIGKELGLNDNEIDLMDGKIFIQNDETLKSNNFSRKIGAYADQRTAPNGIISLLERLREAQWRYRDKPGSSMNNPRTEMLIDCAVQIEKQIMRYCMLNPNDITDSSVSPFIENLRLFQF